MFMCRLAAFIGVQDCLHLVISPRAGKVPHMLPAGEAQEDFTLLLYVSYQWEPRDSDAPQTHTSACTGPVLQVDSPRTIVLHITRSCA